MIPSRILWIESENEDDSSTLDSHAEFLIYVNGNNLGVFFSRIFIFSSQNLSS